MTVSVERNTFLHNYKQKIYFLVIVTLVLLVMSFLCDHEGSSQTGVVIYTTDIEDPDSSSFTPQVSPVIIKMPYFKQELSTIQPIVWFSEPFFAFEEGYKMCLKVYPAGYGDGEGTHVSVYLYLMKGPHDDKLEQSGHWPLRGTFTIELLNQLNDKRHVSYTKTLYSDLCNECTARVRNSTVAPWGWGCPQFISHAAILYHNRDIYMQNDTLHFRISFSDTNIHLSYNQVAPVILAMPNIFERIKGKEQSLWYSGPFFAFKEGYQMSLLVYAAGVGDGEGTHVSVGMRLMKGPYDDKLEQSGHWPLRGTFTIELLNQRSDAKHYGHRVFAYNKKSSTSTDRVLNDTFAPTGWSEDEFISHDTIFDQGDIDYIENNALYFRVTYEANHLINRNQPFPIFKMSNFSTIWLKTTEKEKMWLGEFYAFEEGYRMCLRVFAAGYGDGEGTHISVALHIMKGPHDDKLEQSGHWPLRGIFEVALLNQLNDSDHHIDWILFSEHRCSNIERQVEDGIGEGCGIPRFIPHNSLHQNNYLMNDMVYFRISFDEIFVIDLTLPSIILLPVY